MKGRAWQTNLTCANGAVVIPKTQFKWVFEQFMQMIFFFFAYLSFLIAVSQFLEFSKGFLIFLSGALDEPLFGA